MIYLFKFHKDLSVIFDECLTNEETGGFVALLYLHQNLSNNQDTEYFVKTYARKVVYGEIRDLCF